MKNPEASQPFRVALVSGGVELGGSSTFLCNIAGELVRRGIPTEIFSFEADNPYESDFARLGVTTRIHDHHSEIFEATASTILKELANFRPTAVIACLGGSSFEVLRYLPAGVLRVGLIQSDDPGVYHKLAQYARHLDRTVGVSKLIAEKLRGTPGLENIPAHYLPYGVPMPEAAPVRNRNPADPLRILYIGRLEQEQKRVRLFPEILSHLRSAGIPFEWTIAGGGPERSYLESVMKSDERSLIRFTGGISYRDVPAILAEHDIFLLASDFEGLPLSLLEGMGAGLVPVVSNIPSGVRDVIHTDSGFLVEMDDIKGYAIPIIHLHHHRDELSQKSRRSREFVSTEFSVRAMTDRWIEEIFAPSACVESPAQWIQPDRIAPPLGSEKAFSFSPLGTVIRKIHKKLRMK